MAHVPAPRGQILTTGIIRSEYAALEPFYARQRLAEFDAWLAEHDHEVRTQWEMTRKADPFVIENINGEAAGAFLKRAKAEAWDEAVDAANDYGDLDGGVDQADMRAANPYRSET